jgi:hypothetical protein
MREWVGLLHLVGLGVHLENAVTSDAQFHVLRAQFQSAVAQAPPRTHLPLLLLVLELDDVRRNTVRLQRATELHVAEFGVDLSARVSAAPGETRNHTTAYLCHTNQFAPLCKDIVLQLRVDVFGRQDCVHLDHTCEKQQNQTTHSQHTNQTRTDTQARCLPDVCRDALKSCS